MEVQIPCQIPFHGFSCNGSLGYENYRNFLFFPCIFFLWVPCNTTDVNSTDIQTNWLLDEILGGVFPYAQVR